MDDLLTPDTEQKRLVSEVWHTYLTEGIELKGMQLPWFEHPWLKPFRRALPADPRCQVCYIPFKGVGGIFYRGLLGVKPSKLHPHICNVCERFAERNPGGAEVEVSIIFADIRGSTPMAEKMNNMEFSEIIQRFYAAGTKALYKHNALIEKFVGDGLAAFFAPAFSGPNHAIEAIKAGQEILLATGHGEGQEPWAPVGIGVNTGVAYIGSVQSPEGRTDITILGDVVNTTARLSSEAAAGEILVGPRAMELSGLSTEGLGAKELSLKGKEELVKACTFTAETQLKQD